MRARPPLPPPPYAREDVLRRMQLEVWRRLSGLLHGDHLGRSPGPGSEAAESRAYTAGDDVRRIDWAVTARTTDTHVRTTVAERELSTTVVLDLSPSMSFGTTGSQKRELAIAAATGVLHLVAGPGDQAGVLVVGASGLRRLPPVSGREATAATLRAVAAEPRERGTAAEPREDRTSAGPDLAAALAEVARAPRTPGLVVVVSDLLGDPGWQEPLRRLAARTEVLVCEVLDPREVDLPAVGLLHLVDPETGRSDEVLLTGGVRARFAQAARARRAGHLALVRRAGAGHVVLRTDGDWVAALAHGLQVRRRTRGRAGA